MQRSFAMLALLLACGAPRAPAPAPPPTAPAREGDPEPSSSLVPEPLPCEEREQCRKRVELAPKVNLFADADATELLAESVGVEQGLAAPGWPVVANADEGSPHVQLVCTGDAYWSTVFVARRDLAPVVTTFVMATPERGKPTDPSLTAVGGSLAPGTIVRIEETEGDDVKVAFEVESVSGSGWIPRSAIGDVYDEVESDPRSLPNTNRDRYVWDSPVEVLDAPRGRVIAKVQGSVEWQTLAKPRNGKVLVAVNFVLEQRTYAVGWVPEKALARGGGGLVGGLPLGMQGGPHGGPVAKLVSGTELHSEGGRRIGVMLAATSLPCLADCDGKTPVVQLECVGRFAARVVPR